MRLFIAVNFDYGVKQKIIEAQERLKKSAVGGNFTSKENLHLTLVFFGEKNGDEAALIKKAMNGIDLPSFEIRVGGLGKFNGRGGDTWWLGTDGSERLAGLRNALIKELGAAGISFEEGRFSPHITLARQLTLKPGFDCAALSERTESVPAAVTRISLMESARVNGRLVYNEIYSRKLRNA